MSAASRRRLSHTLVFIVLYTALTILFSTQITSAADTCSENIFYSENHEGGSDWISAGGFASSATYALPWDYQTSGVYSYSGSSNWFADNWGGDYTTEARLMSPAIAIPAEATGEIFLRFYHYYQTEIGKDGGVVELSVNSDGFAQIPGTAYVQNGYPRMLSGGTVLGIVDAFSGTSPGYPAYAASVIDLSSLVSPGDWITLRFRMATDVGTSDDGWYIDDMVLGYCEPSNTPPSASDLPLNTLEDTSVNGTVTATDADNDTLTFSLDSSPSNGSAVVNTDGSLTYSPNQNFNGNDSFTVAVSDGNGGSDIATVSISITPVNDAPSFSLLGDPSAVDEDAGAQTMTGFSHSISAGAPDESGQTLTFALNITGTSGGLTFASAPAIDPLSGTLRYTTAPNASGTATVQVTLSDNGGTANGGSDTSAPQAFTITVNAINDPPIAADLNTSTPEDTTLNALVTATDIDSSPLTFALDTQAAHGTASVSSDGSFSYAPNPDFVGDDVFTFSVSDGSGGSDTATVAINVGSVNDNPVVDAGQDQIADLNASVTVNAAYTDTDTTDTHSASITWGDGSAPEDVVAASGGVSASHAYTSSGNFTSTITVTDNHGGSGSDTLVISVNAPTLTPTATMTPTATSTQEIPNTLTPTATPSVTPTSVLSVTNTPDMPPPPPAPLAAEVNANPSSIVRAGVPDDMSNDIHIREIVVNGQYPTWQGSSVTNSGFIGNPGILEMGVLQAVDVFSPGGLSYFEGGIVVCLRGEGTLVYLNAKYAPRTAEIVGSYTVPEFPGFTCVTLFEPGTLVLVNTVE